MWYIIMISAEANMILIINKSSLICDKIISHDKMLTFLKASSAWYVIMISAEANMMSVIKVSRKKFKFIIITHMLLVKKNKKQRLTKNFKSDFKTDFKNVKIDCTKYKIL